MLSPYEQNILDEILRWERQDPSAFHRLGRLATRPVEWVADTFVPQQLQQIAGESLHALLNSTNEAVHRTVSPEPLIHRAKGLGHNIVTPHELRTLDLALSDALVKRTNRQHISLTAVTGASLGLGGVMFLAVDIPTLFAANLRMIQHAALSYGYDLQDPLERHFALQLLHVSAGDPRAKMALLEQLAIVRAALGRAALEDVARGSAIAASLQGLRKMAQRVGIEITERKMLNLVPIIGVGIGATFNYMFTREVATTAMMGYRKRWLAEKYPDLFPTDTIAGTTLPE